MKQILKRILERGIELKFTLKKKEEIGSKNENSKPPIENDYFTRYYDLIKWNTVDRFSGIEGEMPKTQFWNYLEGTYNYAKNEKKKLEHQYFDSENKILFLGFLITCGNALVAAVSSVINIQAVTTLLSFGITALSAFLTYSQAVISNRKFHETWMRHVSHFIDLNKECRNYAERFEDYYGISDDEALDLFIKRIYEIEDKDEKAFYENVNKLDSH